MTVCHVFVETVNSGFHYRCCYHVPTQEELLDLVSCVGGIPREQQRVQASVSVDADGSTTIFARVLLGLRGGKGGFGSLLRGGTQGVKKVTTVNYDACRDLNGRRLRHVVQENQIREWEGRREEREAAARAQEWNPPQSASSSSDVAGVALMTKFKEDSEHATSSMSATMRDTVAALDIEDGARESSQDDDADDLDLSMYGLGGVDVDDEDEEEEERPAAAGKSKAQAKANGKSKAKDSKGKGKGKGKKRESEKKEEPEEDEEKTSVPAKAAEEAPQPAAAKSSKKRKRSGSSVTVLPPPKFALIAQ